MMKDEKGPGKLPHFIIHPSSFILFSMSPVAASGKPFIFASVYS